MKILMINKFLHANGGSETYIFKLGEQLQKMGHEVQYFGMVDSLYYGHGSPRRTWSVGYPLIVA